MQITGLDFSSNELKVYYSLSIETFCIMYLVKGEFYYVLSINFSNSLVTYNDLNRDVLVGHLNTPGIFNLIF